MRVCNYRWFTWLVAFSLVVCVSTTGFAAALPTTYNGKMNAAVGGVIQQKVSKWGFAANDARATATLAGVGAGLGVVAVGVAGVGVAAVSWPALLAGAALTAVVTGAVALGQDAAYKWLFNSDGSVSTTGAMGAHPWALPGLDGSMVVGGGYFGEGVCKSGSPGSTIACATRGAHSGADKQNVTNCELATSGGLPSSGYCDVQFIYSAAGQTINYGRIGANYYSSGAPVSCPPYMVAGAGGCASPFGAPTPQGAPALNNASPSQAIANVPDSELTKPLSDEMLAAAVNASWLAQVGDIGLPWSASDPVTSADVATWRQSNPDAVPTVADFLAPATAPAPSGSPSGSVGPVPISPSASNPLPAPGPAPSPGTGQEVDLGTDPNIGPPGLEPIPTASQILGPLLDLMPDLRSFVVPSHIADCPKPSFAAFNQSYTFDSHCGLLEGNRAVIEGAMLLVWSLLSVMIVLRA